MLSLLVVHIHALALSFYLLLQSDDVLKLTFYHFFELKDSLVFMLGAYNDIQLRHSSLILIELSLQESVIIHYRL